MVARKRKVVAEHVLAPRPKRVLRPAAPGKFIDSAQGQFAIEVVKVLAGNFTGLAARAAMLVEIEGVLAHMPFRCLAGCAFGRLSHVLHLLPASARAPK